MNKSIISERFKTFGIKECSGSCNLYEILCEQISEDDELLELCTHVQPGQPIPNLFLASVHYLLLTGKEHSLKAFYGSIVESPKNPEQCFPYFKDFCLQYQEELISLLKSKLVQTNEVRRCSYLYPSFCYIYQKVKKPLALIEIGTSAGLQLLWDTYCYSYGDGEIYGNIKSDVHITAEIKGGKAPLLLKNSPSVVSRAGLDLHVNDLRTDEDYVWLQALIWPSHNERRLLFQRAAQRVMKNGLELIEGDGIPLLPEIAEKAPKDAAICVFHTHVANQLPAESKHDLLDKVKKIGQERDIFHLYNNIQDRDLHLDYYLDGKEHHCVVAETDPHGSWFSWKL